MSVRTCQVAESIQSPEKSVSRPIISNSQQRRWNSKPGDAVKRTSPTVSSSFVSNISFEDTEVFKPEALKRHKQPLKEFRNTCVCSCGICELYFALPRQLYITVVRTCVKCTCVACMIMAQFVIFMM